MPVKVQLLAGFDIVYNMFLCYADSYCVHITFAYTEHAHLGIDRDVNNSGLNAMDQI